MHRPLVSQIPVVADANAPGHDRPKQQPQADTGAWGCIFIQAIFINHRASARGVFVSIHGRIIPFRLHPGYPRAVIRPP